MGGVNTASPFNAFTKDNDDQVGMNAATVEGGV